MITALFPHYTHRSSPDYSKQFIVCIASDCARARLDEDYIGYLASCNEPTKYYQCRNKTVTIH